MKSSDIKRLLEKRHSSDLFYCEVKTGSTWYSNFSIIDAIAIPKSWKNFAITGYEVKVSRGDFLQDNKWHKYLPYCNELYFAVPNNLVDPSELSDGIGLIYCTEKTTRKIKKAARREIEKDKVSDMLFHLMMKYNMQDSYPFHAGKADFWEDWLERKKKSTEIGWNVRSEIGKRLVNAEKENERFKKSDEKLKEITKLLEKYNRPTWDLVAGIERILKNDGNIDKNSLSMLESAVKDITRFIERYKVNS